MEGHSLIYLIAVLLYLYYIARVVDRYKTLIISRNKIKKPEGRNKEDREGWMQEVRTSQNNMKSLFKYALIIMMVIPVIEVLAHLVVGRYMQNGQLLTVLFFVLFELTLALVLLFYKNRGGVEFERKFNWDKVGQEFNSRSKFL